jgi:hypothetical protein
MPRCAVLGCSASARSGRARAQVSIRRGHGAVIRDLDFLTPRGDRVPAFLGIPKVLGVGRPIADS